MSVAQRARGAALALAIAVDDEGEKERVPAVQFQASVSVCAVCPNPLREHGQSRRHLTFMCCEGDEPVLHSVCRRCDDVFTRNSNGATLSACPVCPDTYSVCPVCGGAHTNWHLCEAEHTGPETFDSQ